jgi:deoxycytidylate deaminase
MTRDEKMMMAAYGLTYSSKHRNPMAAIITRGNRIFSTGVNRYGTHPKQKNPHSNRLCNSIHCELAAIIAFGRLLEKDFPEDATIHICRRRSDESAGLAFPCRCCVDILKVLDIRRVVYSKSAFVGEVGWFDSFLL